MKKYLIWSQGDAMYFPRIWDGEVTKAHNIGDEDAWWVARGTGVAHGELAYALKNGRFVTLDHEPTPAEVRTLLEGPDPLSECLELLGEAKEYVVAIQQATCDTADYANHERVLKRIEALLEKYREGGK